MIDQATVPTLMWLSVGVGYAWSVWKLDRLWRHARPEPSLPGESKVVHLNGRAPARVRGEGTTPDDAWPTARFRRTRAPRTPPRWAQGRAADRVRAASRPVERDDHAPPRRGAH